MPVSQDITVNLYTQLELTYTCMYSYTYMDMQSTAF